MRKGLFRVWLTVTCAWLLLVAYKTWRTWPIDITWDNGLNSRTEAIVNAVIWSSLPALLLFLSLMLIWSVRGFRT